MTGQFQFCQSLPHKKANFVKKKPIELGVVFLIKTPAMWGVHSEVLMAYPQNNFFSYPVYAVFEKILKNHFFSDYFQNRAFLAVFETFLRSRVSLTLPSLASRHKLFYPLF